MVGDAGALRLPPTLAVGDDLPHVPVPARTDRRPPRGSTAGTDRSHPRPGWPTLVEPRRGTTRGLSAGVDALGSSGRRCDVTVAASVGRVSGARAASVVSVDGTDPEHTSGTPPGSPALHEAGGRRDWNERFVHDASAPGRPVCAWASSARVASVPSSPPPSRAAGHEIVAAAGESDASRDRIAALLPGRPDAEADRRRARLRPAAADRPRRHARATSSPCSATRAAAIREGQYVVHTSGRHGLAVLEPAAAARRPRRSRMHPAMTFTGTARRPRPARPGCVFGLTAGAAERAFAEAPRRRPRRPPDVGARGDAHALPRRSRPRRQPPRHPGHPGDGDARRGRRRRPRRHPAPAAHRRPRQRARARRRRADRPDRARRRQHRPRPPRRHRAPTRPQTLPSYVALARDTLDRVGHRRPGAADPRRRDRCGCSTTPSARPPCPRTGAHRDERRPRRSPRPARSSPTLLADARAGRPAGRAGADDGRPPRGPRQPDAGRPRAHAGDERAGGGVDLRQPAAVRRRRGPRPLPAHPRRRPQALRARGRRHRLRADASRRSTPAATRRSPSSPARSASCSRARPGPATSAAC